MKRIANHITELQKSMLLIVVIGFAVLGFGQKETLVFQISKPESDIEVTTADTVFHVGMRNQFMIHSKGNDKIAKVEVYGSKVFKLANGLYDVSFKKSGPTFIRVFTINAKGEKRLAMVHKMKILPLPTAHLFLCGVKNDSAIDLKHLIKKRSVFARMERNDFDYHPQVLSFTIVIKTDTHFVKGDQIPFELKYKLLNLKEGNIIELLNTRVMLPTHQRNITTIPRFTAFIVETDQYSVGSRKYAMPNPKD